MPGALKIIFKHTNKLLKSCGVYSTIEMARVFKEILYPVFNFNAASYKFSVTALSQFEDESMLSDTIMVKSPAFVIPNIQIWPFKVDSNQITLEWNYTTFDDLKGYRIYQDGRQIADENSLPANKKKLVIPGLKYDMTYTLEMEAVTNSGVLSRRSYPLTITTDYPKKSAANK